MLLGLNLSHDSSAALLEEDGKVIAAIAEERITRVKGHIGIPIQAINYLANSNRGAHISAITVGHSDYSMESALMLYSNLQGNPSNKQGSWQLPYPGLTNSFLKNVQPPLVIVQNLIQEVVSKAFFIDYSPEVIFIKHHKAHLGTTLGFLTETDALSFSLDGEGDGESGSIAVGNRNRNFRVLSSISDLDSLGNLYTAVTKRYNFKPSQHEGKITGLAAFGKNSAAVSIFMNHIEVKNGTIKIRYAKSLKAKATSKFLSQFLGFKSMATTLDEIVSIAEAQTVDYPDLAFAIQEALEKSVLEICSYWIKYTGYSDLNLTGGVFANVKLNQRIGDLTAVNNVRVFPNMGDGGVSLGSAWAHLAENRKLSKESLYENMYLGVPNSNDENFTPLYFRDLGFGVEIFEDGSLPKEIAKRLSEGQTVAIHQNRMEFGPRALGNRSLLADPRDREILNSLNQRLNRTEFMPFAPMVLDSFFAEYFSTNNGSMQPFEYMTMTCLVNEKFRQLIPAVTHVDGTARPQIVSKKNNPLVYLILEEFYIKTGIPVLVNTSLNIHEEPINNEIADSLRALEKCAFDALVFKNLLITKDA